MQCCVPVENPLPEGLRTRDLETDGVFKERRLFLVRHFPDVPVLFELTLAGHTGPRYMFSPARPVRGGRAWTRHGSQDREGLCRCHDSRCFCVRLLYLPPEAQRAWRRGMDSGRFVSQKVTAVCSCFENEKGLGTPKKIFKKYCISPQALSNSGSSTQKKPNYYSGVW